MQLSVTQRKGYRSQGTIAIAERPNEVTRGHSSPEHSDSVDAQSKGNSMSASQETVVPAFCPKQSRGNLEGARTQLNGW